VRTYVAGTAPIDIEVHCLVACEFVSVQPEFPDPPPAPPTVPRTRDVDGIGAHLIIKLPADETRTQDYRLNFGADPGTYRVRKGWKVFVGGGEPGTRYIVRQWEIAEPLPFQQRYLLSVIARTDGLITWPTFGGDIPAPYTFIRVVRGTVLDETGTAVPLNVDLPLNSFYRGSRDAMYFLGLSA